MNKICIIAPDPQALYNLFKSYQQEVSPNTTLLLFSLDISKEGNCSQAVGFISNNNPDYVLVGLDSFNQKNSNNEFELSVYLEGKKIPAHFLLSNSLEVPNVLAILMSQQTGIKDLWSAPLDGKEFFKHIINHSVIYRIPELRRSASAGKGPDNDFSSPYVM